MTGKRSETQQTSAHGSHVGKSFPLPTESRWTVVHFWASWNGRSVELTPDIKRLHAKYSPLGVDFVGVNLDRDGDKRDAFLASEEITWRQFTTRGGWGAPIVGQLKLKKIPAIFLVNPDGLIVEAGIRNFDDADKRIWHHLAARKLSKRDGI